MSIVFPVTVSVKVSNIMSTEKETILFNSSYTLIIVHINSLY